MKILAIDSSGLVATAALADDDRLLAEYTINYKKTHSQTLLPMLDEIKKMIGLDLETIDAIAVAKGPGSFTGLRIGSATAKGLGLALDKPIVAVSTLEALAMNAWGSEKLVCPIMDARREQVYTGVYRFEDGELKTLMKEDAMAVTDLCELLNEKDEDILFLGDGVPVYKEVLEDRLVRKPVYAPLHMAMQRAGALAVLAMKYYKEGRIESAADHRPEYLRVSQAERELRIRPMEEKDLDAVSQMEKEIFSMPWKRDDFADLLDKPDRGYLVAESAGRIVGGAAYRNIAGDVEITNVEIKEGYRGRGLSKMLLKELIKTGRSIGGKQFTLEVRAGNMPAIALYESLGFVREGIRPGFYEQPREDAIIMWLH